MKLSRVSSIVDRGIKVDELLSKFVFGDRLPTKFVKGGAYKLGDIVYVFNTGILNIYQCTKDGVYDDIDDNWSDVSLDEVTSGESPALYKLISISKDEPDSGLIWVIPVQEKMIDPSIML